MNTVRSVTAFILIAGLIMLLGASAGFANSLEASEVEEFFDQQLGERMEKLHIPNATISVVADGKVILEKGYGFANLEDEIPIDPAKSLFRIGSTSKLFTWTAVMQLVEQGMLDLDTDIHTYLDFEIPAKLEASTENAEPAPITLKHLLTHTAGFEDYPDSIFRLQAVDVVPLETYIKDHLPARVFPPGELIAYSNYGTALAGYIVEQVSGLSFAEYAEQHIFTPLRMENSSFRQPLPEELSRQMTQAYRYVDGEYREGAFEYVPGAAGGMSSTAADMARFMLAHLQDGYLEETQILAEDTAQLMHSSLFTQHPNLQGMTYGFMEGVFNGHRTLFHTGSTMLFDTGFYLLPEENVGLFISYSGGNYLVHKELFQAFLDEYYPFSNVETNLIPPAGTKERSSQYLGEYHQNRKSFTTEEKFISLTMGMIHIHWDDEGYLLVKHAGDTYRFVEGEPAIYHRLNEMSSKDPFSDFRTIVFDEDPLGNVVLLTDGAMSYSKVPWYSSRSITFLVLIGSLLFIIGTLMVRGVSGGIRLIRRRRMEQPNMALAARWAAVIYGLLTVGLVSILVPNSGLDPIYVLPKASFSVEPAWSAMISVLIPMLMGVTGVLLLIFTMVVWWKKYWTMLSRIHYTLFTLVSLVMIGLFRFWNLL